MEARSQGNCTSTLEHGWNNHVVPVGLHLPPDIRVRNRCSTLDRVINNDQRTPLGSNRSF